MSGLRPYGEDLRTAWEAFCLRCPEAWFWHTRAWFDFAAALHGPRMLCDASFALVEDGAVAAVAPAMIVSGGEHGAGLALGDLPAPWPAIAHAADGARRARAEAAIFREYERIARSHGAERIVAFGVVTAQAFFRAAVPPVNLALAYGYQGETRGTQVIDLTKDEATLWREVRKGHRSAIRAGQKRLEPRIWCGAIDDAEFDAYRSLHALAAGRVTRGAETFEAMKRWIRDGNGLLVGARADGQWVGFVYFILYKSAAYYASACNHPEAAASMPIGHLLVWEAIRSCRARGIELVEMGPQAAGVAGADAKLASISLFKRGFGGFTLPRYQATLQLVEHAAQ